MLFVRNGDSRKFLVLDAPINPSDKAKQRKQLIKVTVAPGDASPKEIHELTSIGAIKR